MSKIQIIKQSRVIIKSSCSKQKDQKILSALSGVNIFLFNPALKVRARST